MVTFRMIGVLFERPWLLYQAPQPRAPPPVCAVEKKRWDLLSGRHARQKEFTQLRRLLVQEKHNKSGVGFDFVNFYSIWTKTYLYVHYLQPY